LAKRVALLLLATELLVGCSTDRDPSEFFAPNDVGTLVIDGLLIVGKPLPQVTMSRVLSPEVAYTPEAFAEPGATITVQVFPDGLEVSYIESSEPGVYRPERVPTLIVEPRTSYQLRGVSTRGEVVQAQTMTPDPLHVDAWLLLDPVDLAVVRELQTYEALGDSVYFAPENQLVYAEGLLEARFARPEVDAFQLGVFSLDLNSNFVIEPEFFEEDDFDQIERQGSSPALEALEGSVRLPWFAIFFQGRYKYKILALDRNAYDLVRSIPQNDSGFSFGNNLGGNFERPIFHVEGGIGLFGSASADSVGFFIRPRP
jgi:hypothetical protein